MMECPFNEVAKNWWLCPQCGWLYYGNRAPHNYCKKSPDAPPLADRALADALAIPDARDEATIRKLLVACKGCPLYDDRVGCTWGHSCKRRSLWVKRLARGQCEPWDEILGAGE